MTIIRIIFLLVSQSVYPFLLVMFRLLSVIFFIRLPLDGGTVVILLDVTLVCAPAAAPWVALHEIIIDV